MKTERMPLTVRNLRAPKLTMNIFCVEISKDHQDKRPIFQVKERCNNS